MATVDASEPTATRIGALTTRGKARFGLFTLAVLALIALNVILTPTEILLAAFTGWFDSFGTHQVHDMTVAAVLWLAFVVPAVLLLYHPTARVNTILAPVVTAVILAAFAFLANSFLLTGFAIGSVVALAALALHPAGRSLVRFDRVDSVDWRLVGLFALGGVSLLVYAGLELVKQLGPVDEHVLFVHFGAMAIAAFLVVLMGALAVFRQRDWRFAAWFAGVLAAFIGLVSIAYPSMPSSLGIVGGILLLLWAVAYVAGVEYVRRDLAESDDSSADARGRPA